MCFFFQAEDGIRDGRVTGVQTCALPISRRSRRPPPKPRRRPRPTLPRRRRRREVDPMEAADDILEADDEALELPRSEERRVGKECRSRWSPKQYKKKRKEK